MTPAQLQPQSPARWPQHKATAPELPQNACFALFKEALK